MIRLHAVVGRFNIPAEPTHIGPRSHFGGIFMPLNNPILVTGAAGRAVIVGRSVARTARSRYTGELFE